MEEQGEIDGWSVEAVVQKPFRDVERRGAFLPFPGPVVDEAVEDELVLAYGRYRELVAVLEGLLDIIGCQACELARQFDILPSEHQDVCVCAQDHAEIAVESGNPRLPEELDQLVCHSDGAASGTAAAVGRGEGLVQVQVHDVEAHITGTDHSEQGVHVGSVVVEKAAASVHEGCNFSDVPFEKAQCVGVGQHYSCDVVAEERLERIQVHEAVRSGFHFHDLKTADRRAGRVGAMRAVRDDHLRAGQVAAGHVVFAHQHEPGKLTVGTGAGQEGEMLHPGDRCEGLVHPVENSLCSFHGAGRLERVQSRKAWEIADFLVYLGIVFHRAAAERIKSGIDAEVHLR